MQKTSSNFSGSSEDSEILIRELLNFCYKKKKKYISFLNGVSSINSIRPEGYNIYNKELTLLGEKKLNFQKKLLQLQNKKRVFLNFRQRNLKVWPI